MSAKRDRRALGRVAQGDPHALAELYDRHAALLALRLRRRGASPAETEEVLQETFLDVWRSATSFRGDGAVAAWLWGISQRKLAMLVRGEVRARARERAAAADDGVVFDDETLWVAGIDAGVAIDGLPPELRAAFDAVVVEEMSTREAAAHLGVPEGTVKSRLHRARVLLRKEI